jgi:hypothetical protein
VILGGGMLTEGPPASQRLVMAIPAVCVLVVIGLEETIVLGRRLLGGRPVFEAAALVLIVAALAAGSVRYYFCELMPARTYGSENGETATMMGHYLQGFPPGTRAYLFGAPRIYWGFGTMGFLAPQIEGHDVVEPLTGVPALAATAGRPTLFIFLPERAAEMRWVQEAHPGGQVREIDDRAGRPRFIVYESPP